MRTADWLTRHAEDGLAKSAAYARLSRQPETMAPRNRPPCNLQRDVKVAFGTTICSDVKELRLNKARDALPY